MVVGREPASRQAIEHPRRASAVMRDSQVVAVVVALPGERTVHVQPGNGSRRPKLPIASHVYRTGRGPELGLGELDQAPRDRVVQARESAADRRRGNACIVHRDRARRGIAPAAATTAATSELRAICARSRNGARRSLAIRSKSSSTPISRRPASSTGRCRMPWSSISSSASVPERSAAIVHAGVVMTCASGASGPAPVGQHPRAEVAVGDDPELLAELDHDAGRARLDHPPRCVAHAGVRVADQRRSADQLAHRAAAPGAAARDPRRRAGACPAPASRDEAPASVLEHRADRVRRDAVEERLLRRAGDEPERPLLQQRGEAEHLALVEHVEQAAPDRAARRSRGARRRRARRSPPRCRGSPHAGHGARSRRPRHARERVLVERVERGMATQEAGDGVEIALVDRVWHH